MDYTNYTDYTTNSIIYIILFLIILIYIIWRLNYIQSIEGMISSIYASVIVPDMCYNYFITDGTKYYLINTHKIYDGISNPLAFTTLAAANKYLKDNACEPMELERIIAKSTEDPSDLMEKQCSREVADARHRIAMCNAYGENVDLRDLQHDIDTHVDKYNIEECMLKKVAADDPEFINPFEDALKFEFAYNANDATEYNMANEI